VKGDDRQDACPTGWEEEENLGTIPQVIIKMYWRVITENFINKRSYCATY